MAGSTPIYGFPYPEATDLVADYPALGQELAEDIETVLPTLGGVSLIVTETFSAVSSVSVDDCFSADHDRYLLMLTMDASSGGSVNMRLRASGADLTTSTYSSHGYYGGVASGNEVISGTAQWNLVGTINSNTLSFTSHIFSPAAAHSTNVNHISGDTRGYALNYALGNSTASAFDGLTVYLSSGTMTGSLSIYGYRSTL